MVGAVLAQDPSPDDEEAQPLLRDVEARELSELTDPATVRAPVSEPLTDLARRGDRCGAVQVGIDDRDDHHEAAREVLRDSKTSIDAVGMTISWPIRTLALGTPPLGFVRSRPPRTKREEAAA